MLNPVLSCCVAFLFFTVSSRGLRCYTCSYDERDTLDNQKCVSQPWNVSGNPVRTCLPHINYCIIVRIETKDTGIVTSFLRKCEGNPAEDADADSTTVVAHYRSCTTDLCNKGDGLNFIDEGYEGDSVALLVPDKNSAGFSRRALPILITIFFFAFFRSVYAR